MLISPSCAFSKTTQEILIEQVKEIYPCYKATGKVRKSTTPRHQSIQRLRAMQGQSFLGYIKDQVLNLTEMVSFVWPSRILLNG